MVSSTRILTAKYKKSKKVKEIKLLIMPAAAKKTNCSGVN